MIIMHRLITGINYAHRFFFFNDKEREGRKGGEGVQNYEEVECFNFYANLSLSLCFLFHAKKYSSLVSYLLIPFHAADYVAKSDFS